MTESFVGAMVYLKNAIGIADLATVIEPIKHEHSPLSPFGRLKVLCIAQVESRFNALPVCNQ